MLRLLLSIILTLVSIGLQAQSLCRRMNPDCIPALKRGLGVRPVASSSNVKCSACMLYWDRYSWGEPPAYKAYTLEHKDLSATTSELQLSSSHLVIQGKVLHNITPVEAKTPSEDEESDQLVVPRR